MLIPNHLKKGDTVAIVSTARKITKIELQSSLELLKQWGLNVILGKSIGVEDHQFAGDDALRAADLQEMMDHPEVKAIWCARGGYGTVRIIDMINFSEFINHPKWIVGYSDITVLHSHLHKIGIASLHAQMPLELGKKSMETKETLHKALFEEHYSIEYAAKNSLNRRGEAHGTLIGGNLSILYSLCGSPSGIITKGKILFLEDLDEYLYHIDRMMQNLKRNGMLNDLAGLVVGGMTDMRDNTVPFGKTAEEIVFEAVKEYDYPVCFEFPAGHIPDNRAIRFGKEVRLNVHSEIIKLTF
jgi:muramoyltetrapeptide carboxypeptidase